MFPCRLPVLPDSVPPSTLVPPVYEFDPVSVRVPPPVLVSLPFPLITPAKRELPPTEMPAPPPRVSVPLPVGDPTVWLKPARFRLVPAPRNTGPPPKTLELPVFSVPPSSSVGPVNVLAPFMVSAPAPVLVTPPAPLIAPFSTASVAAAVSTMSPPALMTMDRDERNVPAVLIARVALVAAVPTVSPALLAPRFASLVTASVPLARVRLPVNVLMPESASVPVPALTTPPDPVNEPPNDVEALPLNVPIAPPLSATVPDPVSALNVWLNPFRSAVAPFDTASAAPAPKALALPATRVPLVTVVAPE